LRSSLLAAALVIYATGPALAQEAVEVDTPPDPQPDVPAQPPTDEPPEPAPPAADEEPETKHGTDGSTNTERKAFDKHGLRLGIEVGVGGASGTPRTVYRAGIGTGLLVGYQVGRYAVELHVLQSYALSARDEQLRGESTLGKMSATSALAHVQVLDAPVQLSVMGGPALLSVPIFVVTVSDSGATTGDQLIESRGMRGVGFIAGLGAGIALTPRISFSADVRKVLGATWELPSLAYVVPGMHAADGSVMYTETSADATSRPWSATLVARVLLF
jgi:hypothetical protein